MAGRRAPARRRHIAAALALVFAWALASPVDAAAAASVRMQVQPKRVVLGDALTVQVTARGDFDDIVPPHSSGFDFRQSGRSSQMSIVGARVTRSLVLTYTGTPRRKGTWTIEPAVLKLGGTEVARAKGVRVEIVDGRAALGAAVAPETAMALRNYADEPFFVRPVLSVRRPYVGQPVVLSYELYWARGSSVQGIREIGESVFKGFDVEDLLSGSPQRQDSVRIGGRAYMRQVTRKVLLTAAAPGTFELLGPRYRVEVGDFFDSRAFKIHPPPIRVTVRPVPTAGRPTGYLEDAIGRFEVSAALLDRGARTASLELKVGERAVISYDIQGKGNLLDLPDLKPPPRPGMRVEPLPGRADEGVKRTASGTEGKRSWQYLVSFARPGTVSLPPLAFVYFDPLSESFRTVRTQALTVTVTGAAGQVGGADPSAGSAAAVAGGAARAAGGPGGAPDAGEAAGAAGAKGGGAAAAPTANAQGLPEAPFGLKLRPIAPHARIATTARRHFTDAPWFWSAALACWLAALLAWLGRKLHARATRSTPQRAAESARVALQRALADATDHGQLREAVASYLNARLDLRMAGLTWGSLRSALVDAGATTADAQQLVDQLEHCDYARFAPGGGDEALRATRDAIHAAVVAIDADLRAPPSASVGRAAGLVLGVLIASSAPLSAGAATLDQGFQSANAAYVSGDLSAAQRGYEELMRHGLRAAEVHYNLGNVFARQGELGQAVGHYRQAERLTDDDKLAADIRHNLVQVRRALTERSRRDHRVLHVFDESPGVDVALARAAPRGLLGVAVLLFALLALGLYLARLTRGTTLALRAGLATSLTLHLLAGAWLVHAQRVDQGVRHGVVVAEDAPLGPCVGVGDAINLPEGLEVRVLRQRPDLRLEVQLPNGRSGCLQPDDIYQVSLHASE